MQSTNPVLASFPALVYLKDLLVVDTLDEFVAGSDMLVTIAIRMSQKTRLAERLLQGSSSSVQQAGHNQQQI